MVNARRIHSFAQALAIGHVVCLGFRVLCGGVNSLSLTLHSQAPTATLAAVKLLTSERCGIHELAFGVLSGGINILNCCL